MSGNTTKEAFANYTAWQKFIKNDHPKLPKRYNRDSLLLYCFAMAIEGTNGIYCYAGNPYIAEQLEWNRDTVAKYKDLALDLGYFMWTGEYKGRAPILDIHTPVINEARVKPPKPAKGKGSDGSLSVAKVPANASKPPHDTNLSIYECPRCQSYGKLGYPPDYIVNEHDELVIANARAV